MSDIFSQMYLYCKACYNKCQMKSRSIFNIINICYILYSEYRKYNNHKDRLLMIQNMAIKIEDINIVYVKLFQIIANNRDFLTDDERNFLINYTDKVNYSENDIDYDTLDKLRKNDNLFIEAEPCNSGIVALAYRGFYDGEKIIVKLLKVDIERRIQSAIRDLELLFSIFLVYSTIKGCGFIEFVE